MNARRRYTGDQQLVRAWRRGWRRVGIGTGIERDTHDGAVVVIRPAHDGGMRVVVSRPERFGATLAGEPTYVYRITHTRRFV